VRLSGDAVRNEKVKVLQALRPLHGEQAARQVVRGQYTAVGDAPGYLEEHGVSSESTTETFVAMKIFIDNWRWAGVPFYLRHGKALPRRATEIAITFKPAPQGLFSRVTGQPPEPNVLVLRIQPDEGISLKIAAKAPGQGIDLQAVHMDFLYGAACTR